MNVCFHSCMHSHWGVGRTRGTSSSLNTLNLSPGKSSLPRPYQGKIPLPLQELSVQEATAVNTATRVVIQKNDVESCRIRMVLASKPFITTIIKPSKITVLHPSPLLILLSSKLVEGLQNPSFKEIERDLTHQQPGKAQILRLFSIILIKQKTGFDKRNFTDSKFKTRLPCSVRI